MNTASRMESHGLDGGIQVTEETYEKLKHAYRLEMRTYLLTGRIKPQPAL